MWKTIPLFAICITTMFQVSELPGQPTVNGRSPAANLVRFEAFVRGDLPAANEVRAYTNDLKARMPGLEIVVHDVLEDRDQLVRLHELTKEFGRSKAVVPALIAISTLSPIIQLTPMATNNNIGRNFNTIRNKRISITC